MSPERCQIRWQEGGATTTFGLCEPLTCSFLVGMRGFEPRISGPPDPSPASPHVPSLPRAAR